jgi:hypothetical protein
VKKIEDAKDQPDLDERRRRGFVIAKEIAELKKAGDVEK